MSDSPIRDFCDWPTKRQAAAELRVAEKTIERMVRRGEIEQAMQKRPGLGPIAVYNPTDIARAKERLSPVPFMADAPDTRSDVSKPETATALAQVLTAITDRLAALPQLPQPQEAVLHNCAVSEPHFLTLKQARAVSGLPAFVLRPVAIRVGRSLRVPRVELERIARNYGQVQNLVTVGRMSEASAAGV